LREDVLNRGRRIGIGRCRIVAAESFELGADDALRGGNVVRGASGASEGGEKCDQQDEGTQERLRGDCCSEAAIL
jgi:hypothetical protein